MDEWKEAQKWEAAWWGGCLNSLLEEEKQLVYARKMGLTFFHDGKSPYNINLEGKSVLDIGGGPCSLLLKCVNRGGCLVVDPCKYPQWVLGRYEEAEISFRSFPAEEFLYPPGVFGEAWIYNCLQHVKDPAKIIANAKRAAKIIRIFEWIDIEVTNGHIHKLSETQLNEWLGGMGKVEELHEGGCNGRCYYGIFLGDSEE